MQRRDGALLLLVVAVLAAGCTSTLAGERGATPTPTDTPEECTPVVQQTVDPYRGSVEPSAFPDRPETWNESSVETYVVAVERAYSRNTALVAASTRVEVSVSDVSVSTDGDTWVVHLTSRTFTWARPTVDGTRTATPVHGDGPYVPVVYRLTDRGLYRSVVTDGTGTPSASATRTEPKQGVAVTCFEE